MALDDLGLELDFPTLLIAPYWVEHHCVIPDGFRAGDPFDLVDWQARAYLNHYRLRPTARVGQLATAFHNRRTQIVLPQKAGKAPYTATHVCLEGVGPALFAGWAQGGELWDCRDHGCGCGWSYEYQPGEGMGQRWPTPLIQITAFSEKQTDNIYSALRPMIDDGPLSPMIPKTGEEFIRLPNGGRIDTVTSEARSRLGARVTFCPQDETGIWTASAGMIKVAETQRRGLSGTGGRAEETTNAWDPNEDSVAQRTAEAAEQRGDIFRIHTQAPRHLSYRNKEHRRKIHKIVYEGCAWIDLDAIEAEAAEIIIKDPGQAERFYGNNPVAGAGKAFDMEVYESRAKPDLVVPRGAVIGIGIDGARHDDALAVVAVDIRTGHQWPLCIIERPENAGEDYEHDMMLAYGAVLEADERFNVWRIYIDDQWIDHLVELLRNRLGSKRVVVWPTYRPRHIAWAVREYEQAIASGSGDTPPDFSHDGNETMARHHENARRRLLTVRDDKERFMHTLSKDADGSPRKMDGAMAGVLARKVLSDGREAGVVTLDEFEVPQAPEAPKRWTPGVALPQESFVGGGEPVGPMGKFS